MKGKDGRVSKRAAAATVIAAIVFVLVAAIVIVAVHSVYLDKQRAEILNADSVFASANGSLILYYADGKDVVDFSEEIEVNSGASFSITKIEDEDGLVTKASGTVVDVSVKSQRLAVIEVVSASGKVNSDYRITVAPASSAGNTISYNAGDGTLDVDALFPTYSGDHDVTLPTPVKSYTGASGNTVSFDFLGWYTSPDFEEDTKTEVIPAGSSGEYTLYAKFADYAVLNADLTLDGYTYVYYGSYPQSQVSDFELSKAIKASDEFKNAESGSTFTYNGGTYYKFKPTTVPNLSANGYSSNNTYVFIVEPIEWRVLTTKDTTPTAGSTVILLASNVLNCAAYSDGSSTIQSLYESNLSNKGFDLTTFEKYYYDMNTMYYDSPVRTAAEEIYTFMSSISGFDSSIVQTTTLTRQSTALSSSTTTYTCNTYLLSYDEVTNEEYGFSSDYTVNDNLRKAMVSDFAAANGAYRATSPAHVGQGTWWLRGAGDNTYTYKDKRVAYVKYTGYVHAYGATNWTLRSGIRPALSVTYTTSAFTA